MNPVIAGLPVFIVGVIAANIWGPDAFGEHVLFINSSIIPFGLTGMIVENAHLFVGLALIPSAFCVVVLLHRHLACRPLPCGQE